jgi:adenosylcobyric acid synthase
VRQRRGHCDGHRVSGYEIHHGIVGVTGPSRPWIVLDDVYGCAPEGVVAGRFRGTTLHGLLEGDAFRAALLCDVAAARAKKWVPAGVSFAAARTVQWDRLADALEAHVDIDALLALL